jgi:predicted O-linked N-acetylglucosamine transferase (SPINDLY family)
MPTPHDIATQARALTATGKSQQASTLLTRALARSPKDAALHLALSDALLAQGEDIRGRYHARLAWVHGLGVPAAALAAMQALLRCDDLAEVEMMIARAPLQEPAVYERFMGAALAAGTPSLAVRVGTDALHRCGDDPRRAPGVSLAYASALLALGKPEAAFAHARLAAERTGHGALLQHAAVLANYCEEDPTVIRALHDALARHVEHAVERDRLPAPLHDPDPARPLRIALLSGDFREHSVMWFLRAFLTHRGRAQFYLACFCTQHAPDAATEFVRAHCDAYHDITALHPARARDLITRERTDILIDLAGHSSGSAPHLLALRPAPLQATMIGYPATTGLSTVDLRIVDSLTDPTGSDAHASERLARLDPCFLCYTPRSDAPTPVPRPADAPVIFASFNAQMKHTERTLALWSRVLAAVPASRLVMKNKSLGDAGVRSVLAARLRAAGTDPARVDMLPWATDPADHMRAYQSVDIALDTYPYHGTTTTCEALWMGVPVVSRVGRTHAARVGLSLLTNTGLADLACDSDDSFVAVAVSRANDPARRAQLRSTLRAQMLASPLCYAPAHTRRLESLLREEWGRLCARAATPPARA